MTQVKTAEEQLVLLNETITHYSENVKRRCVTTNGEGQFKCKYSGTTIENAESDGCAIGRLLTPELRIELDAKYGDTIPSGVEDIWEYLPDEIKGYGRRFLVDLQRLHDEISFWNNEGLTESGKNHIENIKQKYSLVVPN